MYGDRVLETTTTTGTGTVTLLGASAGGYQAIAAVIPVGDPVKYTILDANGTDWETAKGVLASSSTVTRGSGVGLRSSTGSVLSLSAGTHRIFIEAIADDLNQFPFFSDFYVDHVKTGLKIPTSGSLSATMTAGVAYVLGRRVEKGPQAHTYTASRDTYVDVSNTGLLTYSAVTNGSAAPAVATNSIRVSKVVTSGSAITSTTDLANRESVPSVFVSDSGSQSLADAAWTALTFDTNISDSTGGSMHSTSSNQSHFPVPADGKYVGTVLYNISLNSANTTLAGMSTNSGGTFSGGSYGGYVVPSGFGHAYHCFVTLPTWINAGDYAEFFGFQAGASTSQPMSTGDARASLIRVA